MKKKDKKRKVKKKTKTHPEKLSSNESTLEKIRSFRWFRKAARQ